MVVAPGAVAEVVAALSRAGSSTPTASARSPRTATWWCWTAARWWPAAGPLLTDEVPTYEVPRDARRPLRSRSTSPLPPEPDDLRRRCCDAAGRPNIASKRWIFEPYDHMVGRRHRSAGPAATRPWCGFPDRSGRWRSPPTAPALLLRRPAPGRPGHRCPRRRATWPASGREPDRRDRLPQLRQPREGLDGLAAGGGDRRDEPRRAGRWACRSCRATCRSTMRARAGRSFRRRWWG